MQSLRERREQQAKELLKLRQEPTRLMPPRLAAQAFVLEMLQLLFPQLSADAAATQCDLALSLAHLEAHLAQVLKPLQERMTKSVDHVLEHFFESLPQLYRKMDGDAHAIFDGDPAAESYDEVIVAYPGFFAIAVYRLAHEFYDLEVPVFPRILTEYAHQITGVDIHPGAKIDECFFIDHGTGTVIGETAVIGKQVKLYQGVTLGALSVDKKLSKIKRHPTLENGVIVYSNATILGGETVVGHDSIIGGNVWLTSSVPPYSTVYHKSEVHVRTAEKEDSK